MIESNDKAQCGWADEDRRRTRPKTPSELATPDQPAPQGSLRCDALVRLLRDAELDYKAAILEYEKAEEEGVSSFYEHNTASYKKGICDAYRNLVKLNIVHEPTPAE